MFPNFSWYVPTFSGVMKFPYSPTGSDYCSSSSSFNGLVFGGLWLDKGYFASRSLDDEFFTLSSSTLASRRDFWAATIPPISVFDLWRTYFIWSLTIIFYSFNSKFIFFWFRIFLSIFYSWSQLLTSWARCFCRTSSFLNASLRFYFSISFSLSIFNNFCFSLRMATCSWNSSASCSRCLWASSNLCWISFRRCSWSRIPIAFWL